MRKSLLIIALLQFTAPGAAHADWGARKSEAMSELEKATVSDQERASLETALDTYFGGREDCFEGLLALIAKHDEPAQQPTFRGRVVVCAVGATQVLSRALNDVRDPTTGALTFLNMFATNEASFYQSLAAVTAADARDQIVVIGLHLAEMTRILDEKWSSLIAEDATLDDRAKEEAKAIRADYDAVVREVAETNKDVAEKLAEAVKTWADNEGSPTPSTGNATIDQAIEVVKGMLGTTISWWQATNTRAEKRVRTYRTVFTSERRVLVMFEEVRDDVTEFLEGNDYPKADAAYAAAKSSLDTFASSGKTSGQASDASELRDDLIAALAVHLKETADTYATFVGKHKEKFFGALGPDVKRELTEHENWQKYADEIDGYGLDSKLRDWQTKATNYFEVDLSKLSSDARDRLRSGLRSVIDDLIAEYKNADRDYREVKNVVVDERGDVEDELK